MALFVGLPKALRLMRERAGFRSQEALAVRAGITAAMVSRSETGESTPHLGTLDKILEAMGSDLRSLADVLDEVNGREVPAAVDVATAEKMQADYERALRLAVRALRSEPKE